MQPYKALFTGGPLSTGEQQRLHETGLAVEVAPADLDERQLAAALVDKDAYILGGVERVTAAAIAGAARLQVIAFLGVGYAGFMDVDAVTRRGVAVTNAPGANARAVAEFSIALMLDCWRRVTHLVNQAKAGRWNMMTGQNIENKTIGIVGFGSVGSKVARIASTGLGMRVLYASRTSKPDAERQLGAVRRSLEELLAQSDVVSVHVPYGPETDGLLDDRRLGLVKQGGILLNLSEAEVVNPHALRSALLTERLAAAAMDGYYIEPIPSPADDPHKLLELPDDKFLVSPHVANATEESHRATLEVNIRSIRNILDGKDDPHIVNPQFRRYRDG